MEIFFAGSIRGGRELQPLYQECIALLKQYGTVLSDHVAEDTLTHHGETEMDEARIHDKELEYVARSSVVVAEVTTPSLGVGYLIASARNLGKRVICLYYGDPTHKLSAMIQGDKSLELYPYHNSDELKKVLANCLASKK